MRILLSLLCTCSTVACALGQDATFDTATIGLSDTMKLGSSYALYYSSEGNFHSLRDTINITRSKEGVTFNYKGKAKMLEGEQLKALRKFEFELLREQHAGNCSTSQTYSLSSSSGFEWYVVDASCSWNGFDKLLKSLGEK